MSSIIDPIEMPEFSGDGLELIGTDGFNALNGTEKGDYVDARGAGDLINTGEGDDLIDAGMGGDFIQAGTGNDTIFGGGGKDVILAGTGDDVISAGQGNDVVFGNAGADLIQAGEGDDSVFGGTGDDTINGGGGNDILFGDSGNDVFEFAAEDLDPRFISRIGDFEIGEDNLIVKGLDSEDKVSFDPNTGYVSINGKNVISLEDLGDSANINMDMSEPGDFEIM